MVIVPGMYDSLFFLFLKIDWGIQSLSKKEEFSTNKLSKSFRVDFEIWQIQNPKK